MTNSIEKTTSTHPTPTPGDTGQHSPTTAHRSPLRAALADRSYRIYAPGSHISAVGTWMQRISQDWLVLTVSGGSATALGTVTALQLAPIAIVGPLGGYLADRVHRRRALLAIHTTSALLACALLLLAVFGSPTLSALYLLAIATGVISGLESPIRATFLHDLVGESKIAAVVGLESASGNTARLTGPALAGGLIALWGVPLAIAFNVLSFVAVIASLVVLGRRAAATAATAAAGTRSSGTARTSGSWALALASFRRQPDLAMVMACAAIVGLFAFSMPTLLPIAATEVFGRSAGGFGVLASVLAVGSIAGAVLAARRATSSLRILVSGVVLLGASYAICSLAPTYATFAAGLVLVGITQTTASTAVLAYLQLRAPAQVRGRLLALQSMLWCAGAAATGPIIGAVTDRIGAQQAMALTGLITLAATAITVVTYLGLRGLTVRARAGATVPRLIVIPRADLVRTDTARAAA